MCFLRINLTDWISFKHYFYPFNFQLSIIDEKANYKQITKEKSVQVSHEDYDAETKLNLKQEIAFTIIMERINSGRIDAFFIDGLGGTCKTFLY